MTRPNQALQQTAPERPAFLSLRGAGPSLSFSLLVHMSARFLRMIVLVILILGALPAIHAHEDTFIRLKGTELIGLPRNYAPAELDMKAFRLRIAKHEMTFSPFLKSLFEQPHDLRISASWYHDSATLPPYILLHIQPKKKDFSYDLLLNLGTLELVELSVVLRTSDSSTWDLPIALRDQWRRDIRSSIRTLK